MATTTTTPPAKATNGALIRWAFDRFNARDVDAVRSLWTASTIERFPDTTVTGSQAIGDYFEAFFAALPDAHMAIVALAEQDEHVFVQWRITGTHTGAPFQSLQPSGRRVELDGMDHFTVIDGKVAANFVVYDQLQFARCIGLMPPENSVQERAMQSAFNARVKLMRRLRR